MKETRLEPLPAFSIEGTRRSRQVSNSSHTDDTPLVRRNPPFGRGT